MNLVSPKKLLHSKWTKVDVLNKEKHFSIIDVEYNDEQKVLKCIIRAEINNNEYDINWRILKDPKQWKIGWQ
ncbi:TIGR02450 family Trp-rich protein [Thalassomonas sp. M1454]|uniref:TIGR02450 family Trp-rich protein n=1 Tax=Thalassomonas sp. M1454 TaxID=2594477 RepID=UPI00117F9793|nr:TIGR02450 family Trp-rich protein [Thalassomonas sp. M1454]TRX56381.1 TIGR02450 family Trp-rich protein [Thalassomonas sp. M1454]